MNKDILVSIITVSLNQGQFIEENILSVFNQTYKNIEHIIIDGGSVDTTLDVLKKYPHLSWISEKDSGQSEAFNKGIKISKGDLILFLNSDDYLISSDSITNLINLINIDDFNIYSAFMANTYVVNEKNEILAEMNNRGIDYSFNTLLNVCPVVIHPSTFFIRKNILDTEMYNLDLHYNMDYDFFLKLAKTNPIHSINLFTSGLRKHNDSKGCSKSNWKFSKEYLQIRKKHHGIFFSKLNIQPYKVLLYHIIGDKNLEHLRSNRFVQYLSNVIGLSKVNRVTWYMKS